MKKAKDLTMFCLLKMSKQVKIPNKILCESFLIGVLYLVGTLSLYEDTIRRGRPYVYPTILMVQLFIIKSWMRLSSNNTLHYFLFIKAQNDKLLRVCKINKIPNRRTIDRRFQVLPIGKIIGIDLCVDVSVGSVLQLCHKSKESKNCGVTPYV